jgi:hypothetical protein
LLRLLCDRSLPRRDLLLVPLPSLLLRPVLFCGLLRRCIVLRD